MSDKFALIMFWQCCAEQKWCVRAAAGINRRDGLVSLLQRIKAMHDTLTSTMCQQGYGDRKSDADVRGVDENGGKLRAGRKKNIRLVSVLRV